MRFATPHMLWLLVLVPLVAAFLVWAISYRADLLRRFASEKALKKSGLTSNSVMLWLRMGLFLVALAALITALARPQWGYHEQRVISRGVDMVVAIDTSDSMMARDFQPNRLARAQELLRNLIWEAKGSRVGVVAFAGSAVVMCPLTLDYNMAATALKAVDVNTVSAGGTNIGSAISAAIGSFEISGGNDRVLILLTDGEQTEKVDELDQAVSKAASEGIKVFAVGIGAEGGTNIPTMRGPKRDAAGQVVTTKLDFAKLQEIAEKTGGEAIRAEKMGAGEIAEISAELSRFKGRKQEDKTVRVYHDRYAWFLGGAAILLLLEALLGTVNRLNWPRRRKGLATAGTAAIVFSLSVPSFAEGYPGEGYVRSREGYQDYNAAKFEDSVLQYKRAAQLAPQDAQRLFNLGAASAKAGLKDEAKTAFRTVFDAENPTLNARALFSAATLDHRDIREAIKGKKTEWEGALQAQPNEIEPVKKEISETMTKLQKVIGEYKDALLSESNDTDIKANYELAKKDLEELQNLLDQLNQQQQQQQQQQQEQENEQQKDKNQNEQKQDNSDKGQQQDKGEQGENKDKQDQQGEENKDQQQDKSGQEEEQKDKPQPDQQGKEQQDQQGQQQEGDKPDGKPGDQEQKEQQPDPKGTPSPTPTPTPSPTPTPGPGEGSGQQGQPDEKAPPVPIGQMSPTDVDRLLNTLPPEDQRALQIMFGSETPPQQDEMKNDW